MFTKIVINFKDDPFKYYPTFVVVRGWSYGEHNDLTWQNIIGEMTKSQRGNPT